MAVPTLTRAYALGAQVCVPEDWDDSAIVAFAEREYPSGTQHGWRVVKDGDYCLAGDAARVPCSDNPGFIHTIVSC